MDKANLFKLIKRLNIDTRSIRHPAHGQNISVVNCSDVEKIKEYRSSFSLNDDSQTCHYFYLILVCPDLNPSRVKLGYTNNVEKRLKQYQTIVPTAKIEKFWEISSKHEQTVIDVCITRNDKKLSQEVFDVESLDLLKKRIDILYDMLKE